MTQIPREIFNLGVEFLCGHNDGWVKKRVGKDLLEIEAQDQPKEIKDFIHRLFSEEAKRRN